MAIEKKDYMFSLENLFKISKNNTEKDVLVRFLENLVQKVVEKIRFHLSPLQRTLLLVSQVLMLKVIVLWRDQSRRGQLQNLKKYREKALSGKVRDFSLSTLK